MGIIPADSELPPRHEEIPAWDDMPDEMKPILARQMEVYAGFLEHTDHHVGRVVDAIEEMGALDNTLIYYIIGDNGASAEGTMNGSFNEMANFNGMAELETPEFLQSVIDDFGSPDSYNHYSVGWAWAMSTPFQWTKQVASHWGGTRNGTVVHWPKGFRAKGEVRSQFTHVIDVAPTVLEAAGISEPQFVNGVMQSPYEGTSMCYSFDRGDASERHDLQYFEMVGNRGVYYKGWSAVTKHRTPWDLVGQPVPFDEDVWELYDGSKDFTQATNVASQHPKKLAELQRLFLIEATKYNVIPLDDRASERLIPELAGRPTLIRGNHQMLFEGMGRLSENSVVNTKNKSWTLESSIMIHEPEATGVIMAQGGRFGGWSVYLNSGRLSYVYNTLGIHFFETAAEKQISVGEHRILFRFDYDGGGKGKGGDVVLSVDGVDMATGRVEVTHPMIWSAEETANIGRDAGTPVGNYTIPESVLTGADIKYVELAVGDDSADHEIDPMDRFRLAMKLQ
jgi:arylsulfatase